MTRANARQIGGNHYKVAPIEVWDIAAMYELNGFQQSILRYVLRYKNKDGIKDLEKARHYLDKLIEVETLLLDGKPSMMRALLRQALETLEADLASPQGHAMLDAGQKAATEHVLSRSRARELYGAEPPLPPDDPGRRMVRIERPYTGQLPLGGADPGRQGGRIAKAARKRPRAVRRAEAAR